MRQRITSVLHNEWLAALPLNSYTHSVTFKIVPEYHLQVVPSSSSN